MARINDNGSPVVVLEYQDDAGAGFVGEWLDVTGLAWTVVRPGDPAPDPAAARAVVSLGSTHSAYAPAPEWVPRQVSFLRAALGAGTPVLGICFGAQALALAAGGEVSRAAEPEIGWVAPDSGQPELRGPWLAWHFDAITLPPDAVALARSPRALQAYRVGRSVGVQFHPEVTAAIWESWALEEPDNMRRYVDDPERLGTEVTEQEPALRARLFALLDWWRRTGIDG